MIVVATSAANQCRYCVVAHGAARRIYAGGPRLGDQVAVNYRKADLSPRQRAMREAAHKLARTPEAFADDDVETLLAHGFSREDVWDIGAITALFALSNHMAQLTNLRPNDEFCTLGREPRG